jgi:hypothetical protein
VLGRLGFGGAAVPVIVGGRGGVGRMRWRVARPVVESVMTGDDERRRNQVMKLACSGCSGEGDVVEVASVDEEGMQDLVKTVVEIEGGRNTKGGGSGWLTDVGKRR